MTAVIRDPGEARMFNVRVLPPAFVLMLVFSLAASADEGDKGKWVTISDEVLAKVKPGYPGKTAGITVDPASGDVYLVVPDQGLWKSTDHGESFTRIGGENIGGRCETGFALNFDPAGKRLACFMIYGSSASTSDGGASWTRFTSSHLDFGAVDWESTGKCYLALRHENGGMLAITTDAGKTWQDLGKGFTRVGMFDAGALVCSKERGLVRSEDGGKTWVDVSDVTPRGYTMTVRDGVGYWATERGLLVSKDRGKTWSSEGAAVDVVHGPYWGPKAGQMVVVGKEGFLETTDGGKSWQKAASLPENFKVGGVGPNYAWDPVRDIFYASSMGLPALRYVR
jgi:photosystem II stability/assembly factor-like uncharacterized protein